MKEKTNFGTILKKYNLLFLLVLFILVSTILSPDFLTANNLLNMLQQCAVPGIIAIGMTLVIILGGIDLSVGAVAALSGMVTTVLISSGTPIFIAVMAGIAAGVVMGFAAGYFCAYIGLPDFIVSLAIMEIARGLALLITQGEPVFSMPESFHVIGGGRIGGLIPIAGVIWIILTAAAAIILRHTGFGRSLYAIGGNKVAADYSGIRTVRIKSFTYVICAALSGFAGILAASWLNAGQPTACTGYELDAIAACVIGGVSLAGGVGGAVGTFGGVFLLQIITNIFNLIALPSFYQKIAKGIIIIIALTLNKAVSAEANGSRIERKNRRRSIATIIVLVIMILIFAVFGVFSERGSRKAAAKYKIGFSQCTMSSPFYTQMKSAAEEYAEENSIELVFLSADDDVQKQNNDVLNMITGGVDALIINPINSEGVSVALKAASEAGIPVITIDRYTNDEHVTSRILRDNQYMGQIVGEELLKVLGADGEGTIIEIQGSSGDSVMMARRDGFDNVFRNTNYRIVRSAYCDYSRSKAITAAQDLLQGNRNVVAVYAHNDDMALGALQACREAGLENVKVCGIDGIDEAIKAIVEKSGYDATALNDPQSLLKIAMKTCEDVLSGKEVPKEIDAGTELINQQNVEKYYDGIKIMGEEED